MVCDNRTWKILTLTVLFVHVLAGGQAFSAPVSTGGFDAGLEMSETVSQDTLPPFSPSSHADEAPDLLTTGARMWGGMIVMIGLLLVAFYGIRWLQNRTGGPGKENMIRVLSTRCLGSKHSLSVIDVSGEQFVIGISPGGIRFLTSLSAETTAESRSGRGSFSQEFGKKAL